MNIQGAFDSTTFAAIQEALESYEIGRTKTGRIVNMLKCKNMHISYYGKSVDVKVGRPTYKAVSPLLWYMRVDSLLQKLNYRL